MFADIVNFTKYSGSVEPETVVNMLRNLFIEFDKAAFDLDVFKLYTIGDCYVVLSVINRNQRFSKAKEAENVVLMGFQMIDIIQKVRSIIKFEELNMRIGIHTVIF
jgi:class 3 adenylate cyclase